MTKSQNLRRRVYSDRYVDNNCTIMQLSPSVEIRADETHDGVTINWTSNCKVMSREYKKLVKIQYSILYIKFKLTTIAN